MVLAAIPVGFFAGLFGIGGGLISVPFLFFIFELLDFKEEFLMHLSVGTAFAITIMTAASSVLTHNKHKAVNFKKIKLFSFGVILGVIAGAIFASIINTKFLILFFSLVVFIFSFYLLFNKNNQNKIIPNISFLLKLFLGFISGFISAPMGITGAMMNVPILKYFGYEIKIAIGSSAAIGLIIALFGTISFLFSGLFLKADLPLSVGFVNVPAFLIFVPITTFMARIGANTVHSINKNKIQKYFGLFLIVIGTKFLYEYFKL
tara:strand:+ start:2122 stop:2907 length:786 start_codon:yes stop_codon:yes gene_type:complete